VNILAKASCVVEKKIFVVLHMLPSMELNCEHYCKNLLHFKNFFSIILHLLPNHGANL
jgi:hypothetical protein